MKPATPETGSGLQNFSTNGNLATRSSNSKFTADQLSNFVEARERLENEPDHHLLVEFARSGGTLQELKDAGAGITDSKAFGCDGEDHIIIVDESLEGYDLIYFDKGKKIIERHGGKPETDLTLPDHVLSTAPQLVRDFMQYARPLSDVPDEFLFISFLVMSATLIGNKRFVKAGALEIYPIFWTVLFAGSSTMRKTTGLKIAKRPFMPIEEKLQDRYRKQIEQWRQSKKEAEESDQEFTEPEPVEQTLFAYDMFSDVTFWEQLRDNPGLVSLVSEFTALWRELNKSYTSMSEQALTLFDGTGGRRNTKMSGDIQLDDPVWNIAGATTIENFQRTLTRTERGSGFLQRIIPICVEQRTKPFKSLMEIPEEDQDLKADITRRLDRLYGMPFKPVRVSGESKELYTAWSNDLNTEAQELENQISDIGGYYSRLNTYGLKFGLIYQMMEDPDSDITLDNMTAGVATCRWIKSHIRYMLDNNYIFDRAYADRLKLREIISKQDEDIISRTKLMRASHFTKDRLDRALESEIDSGMIIEHETETDGRPKLKYELA